MFRSRELKADSQIVRDKRGNMPCVWKGISSYNGWIRLTEIKGNADTDFQTAGEAENLFTNATRSAELCFPICGVLWGENAEVASPGTSGYWNNTPSYEYKTAATSYRRSLGCMIRGIKE